VRRLNHSAMDAHYGSYQHKETYCYREYRLGLDLMCLYYTGDSYIPMEVVPDSSGVLICRQQPSFQVRTLDLWLQAFHVFVAVYCSRHPGQAANLMKYASTIQKLAQQAGVGAALSYDKSFRQWKEDDPSQLPWEQLNVELFNQALAMGLTQKAQVPPSPARAFQSSRSCCFRFNNTGTCTRRPCPYDHKCLQCGGPHSRKTCAKAF